MRPGRERVLRGEFQWRENSPLQRHWVNSAEEQWWGGRFKGNYRFNLKGQMEQRAKSTEENEERCGMVMMGQARWVG
jgi:hypothetical protein